jgi:hypothetical protein
VEKGKKPTDTSHEPMPAAACSDECREEGKVEEEHTSAYVSIRQHTSAYVSRDESKEEEEEDSIPGLNSSQEKGAQNLKNIWEKYVKKKR